MLFPLIVNGSCKNSSHTDDLLYDLRGNESLLVLIHLASPQANRGSLQDVSAHAVEGPGRIRGSKRHTDMPGCGGLNPLSGIVREKKRTLPPLASRPD